MPEPLTIAGLILGFTIGWVGWDIYNDRDPGVFMTCALLLATIAELTFVFAKL